MAIFSIMLKKIVKRLLTTLSWNQHSPNTSKNGTDLDELPTIGETVAYIYIYTHLPYHNDWIIETDARRKRQGDFFNNILPLTLLQGFERVVQGLHVRGCWRPNINFIFWPHCYDLTLCLSCSLGLPNQRSWGPLLDAGFLYGILSASSLDPELHRGFPRAPRSGVAFPTTSGL